MANRLPGRCRAFALFCSFAGLLHAAGDGQRISPEQAWDWFRSHPVPIGVNYIPANSISYTEMWMPYAFKPEFIDRELSLAQNVGFNCLRVVLPFVVWQADPAAFERRLGAFLSLADRRGMTVIPCFFDDCVFGPITDPVFGKQPDVIVGWYSNGWTPSPGLKAVRDPRMRPVLERYVKTILRAHRTDRRILLWDLYNEPGSVDSIPLLRDVFAWAREVNPEQPVSSAEWGRIPEVTRVQRMYSDVITFHSYDPGPKLRQKIEDLKRLGRPVICTEWMNRDIGSTVASCLPVIVEERVGALSWGLVNGKTQTDLPWGHRPGDPPPKVWQDDLFHPDGTPYDPAELAAFRAAIRKIAARRTEEAAAR